METAKQKAVGITATKARYCGNGWRKQDNVDI